MALRKVDDLTGQVFGWLTVVQLAHTTRTGRRRWWVRCDGPTCRGLGGAFDVAAGGLLRGAVRACAACVAVADDTRPARGPRPQDLTGRVYSRLTVVARAPTARTRDGRCTGGARWSCTCACGTVDFVTSGSSLRRSRTASCGCLALEVAPYRHFVHGLSTTPLYRTWLTARRYPMVAAWSDYLVFARAVGDRPDPRAQLVRRDPCAPHGPDNTYWRTPPVRVPAPPAVAVGSWP